MIRIDTISVNDVALDHYLACKDAVYNRLKIALNFYELVLNPNKTFQKINSFTNTFSISTKSLGFFVENYFDPFYHKTSPIQNFTRGQLLNSLFFQGDRYMLDLKKINAQKKKDFLIRVETDINTILKGLPNDIEKYTTASSESEQKEFKDLIFFIFQYEKLGKNKGEAFGQDKSWNSYKLTQKLNIKVCPYCNKNWINTVINDNEGKITNPQLDHFFPQSVFPLLRLSFYNLIPSCETCNSRIKGDEILPLNKYVHPYVEGFDPEYFIDPVPLNTASSQGVGEDFQFNIQIVDNTDKFKRVKSSFDFFEIDNIYKHHGDIVADVYFKRTKYGLTRIEDLLHQEMFKGMSIDEIYHFVFANFFDENDFNKRPFSKLTKDTLRSLELL